MPPPVSRILETALYVTDLGRAEAFYARLFGFTRLVRDARMCALAIPNREVLLLFHRGASAQPSKTPFGFIPGHDASGHQHLCFSIAIHDLEAWRRHLSEAGIPVEREMHWPRGGISLYFRDPDGHSLEVATPGLWAHDRL